MWQQWREELLAQVLPHAKPEYQKGAMMVMRTRLKVHGVHVPHLRQAVRAWQQAHRQVSQAEVLALVEALWDGESWEERALALMLLGRYHRWIPALTWAHFDRWRRGLDNWGLTDGLADILGDWLVSDALSRTSHLWALIADADVWSRRLALVATVHPNREKGDPAFADLTFALLERVKGERDPMITKAVSWALREMIKHHPDRVAAYVQENRRVLVGHVLREVNNKLHTGLKSGKTTVQVVPAVARLHT